MDQPDRRVHRCQIHAGLLHLQLVRLAPGGLRQQLLQHFKSGKTSLRRHGLVVREVACEARGPGFNSSSDQMVFLLFLGQGGRKNMNPDMINCVIVRIHVDKKDNS